MHRTTHFQAMLRDVIGTSALAIACAAAPAMAQTAPQNAVTNDAGSGDIVVTARRTNERLQDVPLAVSAISGQSLERAGIRNAVDLSSIAPNLDVQSGNTGAGTTVFTIRGQSNNAILISIDSAVQLYTDGVNVSRPYGTSATLVDIARIETLRGPQGTLYGRNTTGGAISIVTKDPTSDFQGSLQATAGNHALLGIQGVVNLPLADGVGLRLVAARNQHDGYGKSLTTGQQFNKDAATYLRAKLKVERGAFTATISGDYVSDDNGGRATKLGGRTPPSGSALFGGGTAVREVAIDMGLVASNAALTALQTSNPAQYSSILQTAAAKLASYADTSAFQDTYSDLPETLKATVGSATLTMDYVLTDKLTLRSISGWRHFTSDENIDRDGTPFYLGRGVSQQSGNFYSEEAQVLGKFNSVNFVLGGYYSYEKAHSFEISQFFPNVNAGAASIFDGVATARTLAAFAQADVKLTDNLSLTGGVRITNEKRDVISKNINGVGGCLIAAPFRDDGITCQRTAGVSASKPSWLASLNYKFNHNVLAYAKVAHSWRSGGVNLRAAGNLAITYDPYNPEQLTEYEVGLKSELFDRRVRLNLAAFDDEYTDVQRSIIGTVPGSNPPIQTGITTNAAKARLRGFEAETTLRLGNGFEVNGSLGYLDPKYITFADFTGDRSAEPWPAPHWNYTISGTYGTKTAFGRVDANLSWSWKSTTYIANGVLNSNVDRVTIAPYGLLNGRLAVAIDSIGAEIAIFGRNILDKQYESTGTNFFSNGFVVYYPGEPRVIGLQLTAKFGGR